MGLIQYYQITWQPVNQAICIFIIMPIVFSNLVSIKYIIVLMQYCNHGDARHQIQLRNNGDLRIPLYSTTHSQLFVRYPIKN